jgi:hypothetical protein
VTWPSGAKLLGGFAFDRAIRDGELKTLAVDPRATTVVATMLDESDSWLDEYSWKTKFVGFDSETQVASGNCDGGSCEAIISRPDNSRFVLRGFGFRFKNGDHHLTSVGVVVDGGKLRVVYRDKNGDDPYSYRVFYSWLPNSAIASTRDLEGSARGSAIRNIPTMTATEPVISGFVLSFAQVETGLGAILSPVKTVLGVDHQIDEIAIEFEPGTMRVAYNDKNDDDKFYYKVSYALVRAPTTTRTVSAGAPARVE